MLRNREFDIEQKPRKRVKLNRVDDQQYNEFKGQAIQQQPQPTQNIKQQKVQAINIGQQIKKYSKIFQDIQKTPKKFRKLQGQQIEKVKIKAQSKNQNKGIKNEEKKAQVHSNQKIQPKKQNKQTTNKQNSNKTTNKTDKKQQISSNWKQFLSKQKSKKPPNQNTPLSITPHEFISIDCQFVKSNQTDCLARVSLVNEHKQLIYDSYVKPALKITDYVTQISGITYAHIKNAPAQEQVLRELKKRMLGKIVVGHTVAKDLEVCGLVGWGGFKGCVDVAEVGVYSPGGKRVGLKVLAYRELGRVVQEGWHSSVEDATVTMELFLKNKQQILKQKKIVKS